MLIVVSLINLMFNPLPANNDDVLYPFYQAMKSLLFGTKYVFKTSRFAIVWSQIKQMWVIFTHLNWVKNK